MADKASKQKVWCVRCGSNVLYVDSRSCHVSLLDVEFQRCGSCAHVQSSASEAGPSTKKRKKEKGDDEEVYTLLLHAC